MIPAARSHLDRYFGYSSPKRVIESLSHSSYSSYGQGAVTYPLSRAGEPIFTLLHAVRRRLPIPVIALATGAAPRPTWTSLPARRCSRCLRARHISTLTTLAAITAVQLPARPMVGALKAKNRP